MIPPLSGGISLGDSWKKSEKVHDISSYIENKMNILKDMLPYKIPPLDRQLMPEAAGEEPKGVLSC